MRSTIAALLVLALQVVPSARGANLLTSVFKSTIYEQTSPSPAVLSSIAPYQFRAFGRATGSLAVPFSSLAFAIQAPSPSTFPHSSLPIGPGAIPGDAQFVTNYNSANAFNSDFPNEGYEVDFEETSLPEGPYAGTVVFPGLDAYPLLAPTITNGTWNESGRLVVDPQFDLSFVDPAAPGSLVDGVLLEIVRAPGQPNRPGANFARTSRMLPPLPDSLPVFTGSSFGLESSTVYNVTLSFLNRVDRVIIGEDDRDLANAYFVNSTEFQLLTTPEPSRALLVILGVGAAMLRRRRSGPSR